MAITVDKEEKKQKKLLIVAALIIVAALVLLWWSFGGNGGGGQEALEAPELSFDMGGQAAIPQMQAEINWEIIEDPLVKALKQFERIGPFEGEAGRDNPFLSL